MMAPPGTAPGRRLVLAALAAIALLLVCAFSPTLAAPEQDAAALTPANMPEGIFVLSQGERLPLPLGEGQGEGAWPQDAQSDEENLERRIRYSRTKLALGLAAQIWSGVVLAALLLTGLSARLRDVSRRLLPARQGTLVVYLLFFGSLTWVLGLPLDYYSTFVVEHQFGLSTETLLGWFLDQLKGVVLGFVVGLPVVAALYWMIRRAPRRWWLGVAGLLILLSVVFATLAPVALAPLFNSYRAVEDRSLVERIDSLSRQAGVRVSEVLVEDTSRRTVKANAYFTGLGPTKRIVLTDNLIQQFTSEEVLVVVAHELGHQVHNDIWRSIAVGSAFYLAGSYLLYRLLGPLLSRFRRRFGFDRVEDVASLPLLLLLFGILSFGAMPALNGYSRLVERQADQFALEVTQDPQSFVSAMEKLGRLNLSDPDPPKILEALFYTHPSIKERIEYARRYEETRSPRHSWSSVGSGSAGSSAPLKLSSMNRLRMEVRASASVAGLASRMVAGRKLLTIPIDSLVF